jgi:hypothetical protein
MIGKLLENYTITEIHKVIVVVIPAEDLVVPSMSSRAHPMHIS